MALAAIALVIVAIRVVLRRRGWSPHWRQAAERLRLPLRPRTLIPGATLVLALVPITLLVVRQGSSAPSPSSRSGRQPRAGPGNADPWRGSRFHPVRPVWPARLAALVPRQGHHPRVQRLGVHDRLSADHHRDDGRQSDARPGGVARAAARGRRQPRRDLGRRRLVLFRAARDAPRLALPHRDPRPAQAGLEALRDRGGDPTRRDHAHAGPVRDRPARHALAPVHDPDVLHGGPAARPAAGPERVGAAAGPSAGARRRVIRARAANHAHAPRHAAARREAEPSSSVPARPRGSFCSLPPGTRRPAASPGSSMP